MSRAIAYYLPREMAILGVVELTLCFAVIHGVIRTAGAPAALDATSGLPSHHGIALASLLSLTIGAVALAIGLYRPEVCLDRRQLLVATGLAALITLAVLPLIDRGPRNGVGDIVDMAELIAGWFAAMVLIRLVYGFAVGSRALTRRVLLCGDPERVGALSTRLRTRRARRFEPVAHHGGMLSWPLLRQQRIWRVVIVSDQPGPAIKTLLECRRRGMRISSAAAFHENYLGRIDLDALAANEGLLRQNHAPGKVAALLKRCCDIVVATLMLVLLLPLMAITALSIRIDSPGPILYRQRRVGQFDTTFTLLKFRSMTIDAEASGGPRWAQQQDPRVTRVGRFIRATRIDELPQLANVIRGEMSLVGPRPERPHFVAQLARHIPFYRRRTSVRPGLTGWAQVNFPYGASVADAREKLAYDLYYLKHRTILLDIIILISTIRVVLFHEGAR